MRTETLAVRAAHPTSPASDREQSRSDALLEPAVNKALFALPLLFAACLALMLYLEPGHLPDRFSPAAVTTVVSPTSID